MLSLILSLFLFSPAQAADAASFNCKPLNPPTEQGSERFVKVDFTADGQATLRVADMASPFEIVHEGLTLVNAAYAKDGTMASARWENNAGDNVAVSLAFFGSWWGGQVTFSQARQTQNLSFAAGEELDLRCVVTDL